MENSLSIFTDGGARGNPGPAAIAFVVFENEKIIYKFSERIGKTTNNVAEYQAVIVALEWLKEQSAINNPPAGEAGQQLTINFFLDSQLVVNQLNGIYKIKDHKLRILILKVKNLERKINKKIFYRLVAREKNKVADALVNQSLAFHVLLL